MDWREALTRQWQYKVAALFVAVLLWVTVTTDEQQDQAVPTSVEWQIRDSTYVLVDAPGQVQTVFQAQMGELLSFVGNNPVIRYAVDSVPGTEMRVSLSTDMVEFEQAGSARALAVRPSEVVLRFEPRSRRRVPVSADVQLSAAEGFAVVDSPAVQPDSVTISGAESEVQGISEVTTERTSIDGLRESVSRDVPVRLPDDAPHVRSDPEIVLVTAEVDSVVERELRRPVRVRGAASSGLQLDPDSATVRLRGPSSVVDAVPADSVEAWVEISEGEPGAGEAVTRELSAGVSGSPRVTAEVEPGSAEVRRGGSP